MLVSWLKEKTMVVFIQWTNGIAHFTAKGSTKVSIYHGAKRCKNEAEISQYDFVLRTYSIIEVEDRKDLILAK